MSIGQLTHNSTVDYSHKKFDTRNDYHDTLFKTPDYSAYNKIKQKVLRQQELQCQQFPYQQLPQIQSPTISFTQTSKIPTATKKSKSKSKNITPAKLFRPYALDAPVKQPCNKRTFKEIQQAGAMIQQAKFTAYAPTNIAMTNNATTNIAPTNIAPTNTATTNIAPTYTPQNYPQQYQPVSHLSPPSTSSTQYVAATTQHNFPAGFNAAPHNQQYYPSQTNPAPVYQSQMNTSQINQTQYYANNQCNPTQFAPVQAQTYASNPPQQAAATRGVQPPQLNMAYLSRMLIAQHEAIFTREIWESQGYGQNWPKAMVTSQGHCC